MIKLLEAFLTFLIIAIVFAALMLICVLVAAVIMCL